MEKWTIGDVRDLFPRLAQAMDDNKEVLTTLDAESGDGDLGITMSLGFHKAAEKVAASAETDLGKLIALAGSAMAQAAPSTMGTLMGSAMMRGGKALQGKMELDLGDVAAFVGGMAEGIMARGKAKPGDKTVLDSLEPAAAALRDAVSSGKTFAQGLSAAADAAIQGLENTKTMLPQHGRAVYYAEKSLGRQDPGATVGMIFVRTLSGQL